MGKPAVSIEGAAAHPSGKSKVLTGKLVKPVLGRLRHRETVKGVLRKKALILVKG
jgi:riboflavin biosynthesis pyrimidine reductase